jgi:hypothetical protein
VKRETFAIALARLFCLDYVQFGGTEEFVVSNQDTRDFRFSGSEEGLFFSRFSGG